MRESPLLGALRTHNGNLVWPITSWPPARLIAAALWRRERRRIGHRLGADRLHRRVTACSDVREAHRRRDVGRAPEGEVSGPAALPIAVRELHDDAAVRQSEWRLVAREVGLAAGR